MSIPFDLAPFTPYIALVPALPLLAAAVVAGRCLWGVQGDAAERGTVGVSLAGMLGALLLLLLFDGGRIFAGQGALGSVEVAPWFRLGEAEVAFNFLIDDIALIGASVASLIGWLTLRFSAAYLHREAGLHRFYLGMNLFLSGMLLIVLGGNALLCFVGWELAGFASWLLIGFARERPQATGNALFAFIANRIGDAGFLLAISLAYWWLGSTDWEVLSGQHQIEALPTLTARLLVLGFVLAAFAKSAQLPFTPWIARALEGPTPSSAIFYGAVMIHAGVFLLIRLAPLLVQVPDVMALLTAVGLLTAVYAYLQALSSSDIKSALVFATVTQVGLMVFTCGLGYFQVATWHLVLHAAFRAWQFLQSPSYMHLVRGAARPAPWWLRHNLWLYTATLRGFWIETVIRGLLLKPTLALGQDMNTLDDRVLNRALAAAPASNDSDGQLLASYGLGGRLLAGFANLLQRFENRLLLAKGGGRIGWLMRQAGYYLLQIDSFIAQPRYLMLMVMATFVVIL